MKVEDINLSELEYRDIIKLHILVRKEYIKRNVIEYKSKCFKVGDVVRFKKHRNARKHDDNGVICLGIIMKVPIMRSGRVGFYHIDYFFEDDVKYGDIPESRRTTFVRGIRQVEKAAEEEARATKLVFDIKT